jgi:hypothetical protein
VSSGVLFHLYLADVSVPLLRTSFVETPQISGGRSIVHFILFLLCFYKLASTFSIECRLRVVTQAGSGCSNHAGAFETLARARLGLLQRKRSVDTAVTASAAPLPDLIGPHGNACFELFERCNIGRQVCCV